MATRPSLNDFEVLSFDCYGTLIDWETGLLEALAPLLARVATLPTRDEVLETYALAESEAEKKYPAEPYPQILSRVWLDLASQWNVADDPVLRQAFAGSVGDWPAFPDTAEALERLKRRYKLIILSNVDRASFARTNRLLGVEFDRIITAQDLGSYKPDRRNFEALVTEVERMGVGRDKLLHVAQSLHHDHVPAQAMGLSTAWIDRRSGKAGGGATRRPKADVRPDFVFPGLAALADAIRQSTR